MDKIGKTIRRAMKESDLSLYELARRAGLSYSRVHELARGVSNPRLSTIEALCNELGLELKPTNRKARR